MRNLWAFSVLAVFTVVQGNTLDYACGDLVYAQSTPTTYYIIDARTYHTLCNVHFNRHDYGKTQLTISGSSLDSSQCSIQVFGSTDTYSISDGEINSVGFFTRKYTSNNFGNMYLHVQGQYCGDYGLSFKLEEVCSGFTCDNGQCVYSSDVCDGISDCSDGSDEDGCFWIRKGVYVGVSLGAVAFLAVVGTAAVVIYRRRRVILVQSAIPMTQIRY